MKSLLILPVLFFSLGCAAQQEAATPHSEGVPVRTLGQVAAAEKTPVLKAEDKAKLQSLTIKQLHIQQTLTNLRATFQDFQQKLTAVNAEGQAAEAAALKAVGADPAKWTTVADENGEIVVVAREGK